MENLALVLAALLALVVILLITKLRAAHTTREAGRIVQEAHQNATKIGGDAYIALRDKEQIERALIAIRNVVDGYGDRYIVPTRSLLDDLAAEFGHTEAGRALTAAREQTKRMVEEGHAAECDYAEANRRETAIRFVIDAFNGRVDAILSRSRHDNYGTLGQEIRDAFAVVNHNGEAFRNARVLPSYLDARLAELKWAVVVHELRLKEREELLHIQRPGATYVATVKGWRRHGREVKREANPLVTLVPFRPIEFVYDVSDTTGAPLPDDVLHPFRAGGHVSREVLDRVIKHAQHDGIAVLERECSPQLAGRVSGHDPKRAAVLLDNGAVAPIVIELNASFSVEAKFATLAHELGHVYCGHIGVPKGAWWRVRTVSDKRIKEFEAEFVAWIVCASHGVDAGSYRYLHRFLGPGKRIPEISMDRVVVAANHVVALTTPKFRPKLPERAQRTYDGVRPGMHSETPTPTSIIGSPRRCSECRLWSVPGAKRCDCGFNFDAPTVVAVPRDSPTTLDPATPSKLDKIVGSIQTVLSFLFSLALILGGAMCHPQNR